MDGVWLNEQRAKGETTSARSNSSGWLHTLRNCMTKFIKLSTESLLLSDVAVSSSSAIEIFSFSPLYSALCRAVNSQLTSSSIYWYKLKGIFRHVHMDQT